MIGEIFVNALRENDYCVEEWKESESGVPSIEDLNSHKLIIWSAGDYWNTAIDDSDMNLLSQYNGNIIVEGSDIALDHYNDTFIEEKFHTGLNKDLIISNETILILNSGHPVMENISGLELNYSVTNYPDSLNPINASWAANWSDGGSAIVLYN